MQTANDNQIILITSSKFHYKKRKTIQYYKNGSSGQQCHKARGWTPCQSWQEAMWSLDMRIGHCSSDKRGDNNGRR